MRVAAECTELNSLQYNHFPEKAKKIGALRDFGILDFGPIFWLAMKIYSHKMQPKDVIICYFSSAKSLDFACEKYSL
jgi:hypothetical protein